MDRRNQWWIPSERPGAKRRLYCFHHAGGTSRSFARLAYALPGTIELAAFELPGRGLRRHEDFLKTFDEVLDELELSWAELNEVQKPYMFFGHSMGAMLAYAFAARLAACEQPGPHVLFASSTSPPAAFVLKNAHLARLTTRDELIGAMNRLGGAASSDLLNMPDMLEQVLETLEADFQLCASFRHSSQRLNCPIVALGGEADPTVPVEHLHSWGDATLAQSTVQTWAGGHFYLHEHWEALAALIGQRAELG